MTEFNSQPEKASTCALAGEEMEAIKDIPKVAGRSRSSGPRLIWKILMVTSTVMMVMITVGVLFWSYMLMKASECADEDWECYEKTEWVVQWTIWFMEKFVKHPKEAFEDYRDHEDGGDF